MESLTKLFKLLEFTRSQPQYGYALRGIKQDELSNLAEHHYLVSIIGWQLALAANKNGGKLDVLKVLELCMVHDLGELFGGDICLPYARINPTARKFAKAFESENLKFMSRKFGKEQKYFLELSKDIMEPTSDEAIVAKLADYLEATHYLQYADSVDDQSLGFIKGFKENLKKIKDKKVRSFCSKFIDQWVKDFTKKDSIKTLLEG